MRIRMAAVMLVGLAALGVAAWSVLRASGDLASGPRVTVAAGDGVALSAGAVTRIADALRPAMGRWREAGAFDGLGVIVQVTSADDEVRVAARAGGGPGDDGAGEDELYGHPGPGLASLVPGLVESLLVDLAHRQARGPGLRPDVPPAPATVGLAWVRVPGGAFRVGGDGTSWGPAERREVRSFEMSRAVVTVRQYRACVDAGACPEPHAADGTCHVPSGTDWGPGVLPVGFQEPDQPVVCVTMAQARRFARWVGARLPDELEWEYAARDGGEEKRFPWGADLPTCARAVIAEGGWGCGRGTPWPVCSKPDGNTRSGLCDMIGNVWQWVEDPAPGREDVGRRYVQHDRPVPPWHVVGRGGAFNRAGGSMDVETRDLDLGTRAANIGFRVVRDVP